MSKKTAYDVVLEAMHKDSKAASWDVHLPMPITNFLETPVTGNAVDREVVLKKMGFTGTRTKIESLPPANNEKLITELRTLAALDTTIDKILVKARDLNNTAETALTHSVTIQAYALLGNLRNLRTTFITEIKQEDVKINDLFIKLANTCGEKIKTFENFSGVNFNRSSKLVRPFSLILDTLKSAINAIAKLFHKPEPFKIETSTKRLARESGEQFDDLKTRLSTMKDDAKNTDDGKDMIPK